MIPETTTVKTNAEQDGQEQLGSAVMNTKLEKRETICYKRYKRKNGWHYRVGKPGFIHTISAYSHD